MLHAFYVCEAEKIIIIILLITIITITTLIIIIIIITTTIIITIITLLINSTMPSVCAPSEPLKTARALWKHIMLN